MAKLMCGGKELVIMHQGKRLEVKSTSKDNRNEQSIEKTSNNK